MPTLALFINGIFGGVLDEIMKAQANSPGLTLYLQPYSGSPFKMLKNNPPTPEEPVKLYASTSKDLAVVSYTADIIGWEDKTQLSEAHKAEIEAAIRKYQPDEVDGRTGAALFHYAGGGTHPSVNLLCVQSVVKLEAPFSVKELVKRSDGKPLSTNRSRSGGYSYVWPPADA